MHYGYNDDFVDGIVLTSSPTKAKVIEKLQKEFGFDFTGCKFEIVTFKGSQDADAYRWFTVGLYPQINSRLTMTEFVKSKKAVYDFGRYDLDGVLIDEDTQHPKRYSEPNFH